MALIRKRGARWQVQIRRKGQPARSDSFASLKSLILVPFECAKTQGE